MLSISMPDPGDGAYAEARVRVDNSSGRAAARLAVVREAAVAFGVQVAVVGVRGVGDRLTDRWGRRFLHVAGSGVIVNALAGEVLGGVLAEAENAAAAATRVYGRWLRERQVEERERRRLRRRWRVAYLAAWALAYGQRLAAARAEVPGARRPCLAPSADLVMSMEDLAGCAARRAEADVDALDGVVFVRARVLRDAAEHEMVRRWRAREAGADLAVTEVPKPAVFERRRARVEVGEVEDIVSRFEQSAAVEVVLGGGRARAWVEAVYPVLKVLRVHPVLGEVDAVGRLSVRLRGPRTELRIAAEQFAGWVAEMETAARHAVRAVYQPWLMEQPPKDHWPHERPVLRRRWREDYLPAWGQAWADRLQAALVGRKDAGRVRLPEGQSGMHGAAPRQARADVDALPPLVFQALAARLGVEAPAPEEPVIEALRSDQVSAPGHGVGRLVVSDRGRRGASRLCALAPVLAVYGLTTTPYATGRGSVIVTLHGHPRLAHVLTLAADNLIGTMDRAAGAALRRTRNPGGQPAQNREAWRAAYCEGWGAAYATRLRAALHRHPDARDAPRGHDDAPAADTPQACAWRDVDRLPAADLHTAAARIAAITQPAGLPRHTSVYLAVAPGPCYRAQTRVAMITAIAAAQHLTTRQHDALDEGREWKQTRECLRLDGPAASLAAFLDALPGLIEDADRFVLTGFTDHERSLDHHRPARTSTTTRRTLRDVWAAGRVEAWAAAYAARLTAAVNGAAATYPAWYDQDAVNAVDHLDTAPFHAAAQRHHDAERTLHATWNASLNQAAAPAPTTTAPEPARNRRSAPPTNRERVVIVPCGKKKAATSCPAGWMYRGSHHAATRAAAHTLTHQETTGRTLILSARHGLLSLDQVIDPYEMRTGDPNTVTPATLHQQATRLGILKADVTILAGTAYTALARTIWPDAATPLAGSRGIGDHLTRLANLAYSPTTRTVRPPMLPLDGFTTTQSS